MKLYTFVRNGVQRLGAAYGDGQMVDLLAASQGDPRLASMMSLIEAGDGTPAEPAWAAVWFQRAAERGEQPGREEHGRD